MILRLAGALRAAAGVQAADRLQVGQPLADDPQRQVLVPLRPQDEPQARHVVLGEHPVAGGRAVRPHEPGGSPLPASRGRAHVWRRRLALDRIPHHVTYPTPPERGPDAGLGPVAPGRPPAKKTSLNLPIWSSSPPTSSPSSTRSRLR